MNYPEWNNAIGEYIFNEANSGKEVLLYLTKNDIIRIGRSFQNKDDDVIWRNFILSIKTGIGSSIATIAENAKKAFNKWLETGNRLSINRIPVKYPLYLSYLVFFVLPITEGAVMGEYTLNNYWDRMGEFLATNNCKPFPKSDFRDQGINNLWDNLHLWANENKNGILGLFTVNQFVNSGFVYVGKPFSQCILPPKVIGKFPLLFSKAGLIPGERYSSANLLHATISFGNHVGIHEKVLDRIRKRPDDELTLLVVRTVRREYDSWEGQSDVNTDTEKDIKQERYETIARLAVQFEFDEDNEIAKLGYRVKSNNDFPEDLKLGNHNIVYERNGFSKPIRALYSSNCFELKDSFNKWVAKSAAKNIRLFVNGSTFQLSSYCWVEVDSLVSGQRMYILAPNHFEDKIATWAKESCSSYSVLNKVEGLDDNLTLIKISGPLNGCAELPELSLDSDISMKLMGGLKVQYRTLSDSLLPYVEVINCSPSDKVALRYQDIDELTYLEYSAQFQYWILPDTIKRDRPFRLCVENKNYEEALSYTIVSSNGIALQLGTEHLPMRSSSDREIKTVNVLYLKGVNLSVPELPRQKIYEQYFKGRTQHTFYQQAVVNFGELFGDRLLAYLTLKRTSTLHEFFVAFEQLYNSLKALDPDIRTSATIQVLRRAALTFYGNLGFIDFDYENNKIAILEPQLILIPTETDRKALLIGGRDSNLIERMITLATEYQLTIRIEAQHGPNKDLLLPSIITIQSHQYQDDLYGQRRLAAFALALGIRFDADNLVQISLQDFSVDAEEYEADVRAHNIIETKDYGWARYVFNTDSLKLLPSEDEPLDKRFAFVEYRLNAWEIDYRLWIDDQAHIVDRNWGKYIALKKTGKNVILYDSIHCKVAVPIDTPLPRYFAMSLSLLSGFAPPIITRDGRFYRVYENVPSVFVQNLFYKLSQTVVPTQIPI